MSVASRKYSDELFPSRDRRGRVTSVAVRMHRGTERVSIGDRFRARGKDSHRVATVTSFYEDGSKAFVRRNTSRRQQAISTVALLTRYDRAGTSATGDTDG